jgi:hypothetical protein
LGAVAIAVVVAAGFGIKMIMDKTAEAVRIEQQKKVSFISCI